jgi:hypothetical protein
MIFVGSCVDGNRTWELDIRGEKNLRVTAETNKEGIKRAVIHIMNSDLTFERNRSGHNTGSWVLLHGALEVGLYEVDSLIESSFDLLKEGADYNTRIMMIADYDGSSHTLSLDYCERYDDDGKPPDDQDWEKLADIHIYGSKIEIETP